MASSVELAHECKPVLSSGERLIEAPKLGLWWCVWRVKAIWRRHRTLRSLQDMEDHLLVDIGLSRDQIAVLRAGYLPELPVKRRN